MMIEESSNSGGKEDKPEFAGPEYLEMQNLAEFDNQSPQNVERGRARAKERTSINIDSIALKTGWNRNEEEELYQLHDEIGNKWALIAHQLPGRTDNCVKNHFYSKLRKAMRKLNKHIHHYYRREFKEIKINAIYKIVQANEQRHKSKSNIQQSVSDYCQKLKNRLLRFSDDEQAEQFYEKPQVRKIITEIVEFNRNYKRQSKRKRKPSGNDQWGRAEYRKMKFKAEEDIYSSEQQEEQDQSVPSGKKIKTVYNPQKGPARAYQQEKPEGRQKVEIEKQQQEGVQSILLNAGMMEDNNDIPMLFLRKDYSILSRLSGRPQSQNPLDHDAFFEESEQHVPTSRGRNNPFNHFGHIHHDHHHDFL